MKKTDFNKIIEQSTSSFSKNLKALVHHKETNQKNLGVDSEVSASTISAYINGTKLPTCEFLIKLKALYPEISIDDMLTGTVSFTDSENDQDSSQVNEKDLIKYEGTYFSYYLDTGRKARKTVEEIHFSETILRKGLLYICQDPFTGSQSEATCLAVFGIRGVNADTAKAEMDKMSTLSEVEAFLKNRFPHNLYTGTAKFDSSHIFITLTQDMDNKDRAAIILHYEKNTKSRYIGGLGTINSSTRGRHSDPIIQLIGFSRYAITLSDEEIKSKLQFSPPSSDFIIQDEADDILNLAEKLYGKTVSERDMPDPLMAKYASVIVRSNIQYLIDKSIENNLLWCGRVSQDDDDNWYHLLKYSQAPQSETEGDSNE